MDTLIRVLRRRYGLRNHGARDALGLGLQQAQDEGPTDSLPVQVTLVDPQVVEQGDVIGCAGVPAVLCDDGRMGLAACVALIQREPPEVVGEFGGRVDGRGGAAPEVDARLPARGRKCEDGEPLAELLEIDGRVVVCKAGHGVSFRHGTG
jgi:hypothetical protein